MRFAVAESEEQRRNRELIELLNELRVALPGVQVLFAFLLAVPFANGFPKLGKLDRDIFFVAFIATALATVLLIAPSSYHRLRWRQHDKERLLVISNGMPIAALDLVVVELVLEAVTGSARAGPGWIAALDHEVRDDAMEDDAVVEAVVHELDEVVHGFRCVVREKLDVNRAVIRLDDRLHRAGMYRPAVPRCCSRAGRPCARRRVPSADGVPHRRDPALDGDRARGSVDCAPRPHLDFHRPL